MKHKRIYGKFTAAVFAAVILLAAAFAPAFGGAKAASAAGGDGRADLGAGAGWYGTGSASTFNISNADQLAGFAKRVNGGNTFSGKTINLTENIDLSVYGADYPSDRGGKGWTPIGISSSQYFTGTFDGGGHTISGLYIDNGTDNDTGLFGYMSSGTIKNLKVSGDVKSQGYYVGGILGITNSNSFTITNCSFNGTVISTNTITSSYVGGVVGCNYGAVTNCSFNGAVTSAGGYVGGVAGAVGTSIATSCSVSNCYSAGTVYSGGYYVGGVAGQVYGTVTYCYSISVVDGTSSVGGVAGYIGSTGSVSNCAALNPSVRGRTGSTTTIGRVAGQLASGGNLGTNAGWTDMTVRLSSGGKTITSNAAGQDGLNIASAGVTGTIDSKFTSANGWTTGTNKLPGLTVVDGMSLGMAGHLITGTLNPFDGGTGASATP